MKTLKAWAVWAFVAFGATAWAETLGNLTPLVQLSSIRREFSELAQSGKLLKVQGLSSTKWSAKSNVPWIKVTKSSGKGGESVTYSVEENDGDAREGEITVISNGESSTFTVRQASTPSPLYIKPVKRTYSASQQTSKEIRVFAKNNKQWTAKSNANWVLITQGQSGRGDGKIYYTVLKNTSGKGRKAEIEIVLKNSGGKQRTHKIIQRKNGNDSGTGDELELLSSRRDFSYKAELQKQLKVIANVPWEVDTDVEWIELETLEGDGSGWIVYSVEENMEETERIGVITVTGAGKTLTFTATQEGRPATKLTLSESSASLGTAGTGVSSQTVEVDANVEWTATSQDSWIKVTDGKSGTGNGTVKYYVPMLMDPGTRSGSITVEGGGIARSFTVHQKGPDPLLQLGAISRTFAKSGGTGKELKVTGNVEWTAKSGASWLTVKKGSGKGGGTVVYDVAKNTGTAQRSARITVTGGGLSQMFLVRQNGTGGGSGTAASLALGSTERTFTADAANSKELKVTANVEWTAKSSASWLTVKTASGSGNGTILYNVAANTGSAERSAAITVEGGGLTRTFTVKQSGKGGGNSGGGGGSPAATLTLGATERTFTADAASGKELKVTADVAWTAKSSASWLTVKTASGNGNGKIVYNVAANTSSSSRTATITVAGGGLTRVFTVTQSGQGSGPKSLQRKAAPRIWVTTSDGTDGAAVADGDEQTGWTPATPEGAWVALSFAEERPVDAVEVIGDRLPANMRALVSQDGDTWSEESADAIHYLWLLLPPETLHPTIREIKTTP